MADSSFTQVESMLNLVNALDNGDMSKIHDALATRIAGAGAQDIADAVDSIQATGLDPRMFIPVSSTYQRQTQREHRQKLEEQRMQQELQHKQELHELKVASLKAELQVKQASANRMSQPRPQQPQQPQQVTQQSATVTP